MAWVNTQLGNAKRSPDGSYRSIQPKYLAHYLAALQYCSNRLYDLVALAETLLRARSAQRTQPSQSETEPRRRLLPRHAALPNGDQSPATFLLHGDSGSRTARVVLINPTDDGGGPPLVLRPEAGGVSNHDEDSRGSRKAIE